MTTRSLPIEGRQVVALLADGFDEEEYLAIRNALEQAGAVIHVASPTMGSTGKIRGWRGEAWGDYTAVDFSMDTANVMDYDGMLIPGGRPSADSIRADDISMRNVRRYFDLAKPVGALGAGIGVLTMANVLENRTVAAPDFLAGEVQAACGLMSPDPVAVDNNVVITARDAAARPAFIQAFTAALAGSPLHAREQNADLKRMSIPRPTAAQSV